MTEESIFTDALQHHEPAERQAFLDRACAGDPALRRRVEALLASHEGADPFLRRPALQQVAAGAAQVAPGGPDPSAASPVGQEDPPRDARPDAGADSVLRLLGPARRPDALGRFLHYEVLQVLGKGGFGTVLKAFDDRLHRVVALKVLAPELAVSGPARQRFLREARAAAAVRHDNVVGIYVVEEQPVSHLVMEFIEGPTLQQKLDRHGPLPVKEVLRIGMQIAEGLAAAHKQGLIHRDIKPSNILLENGIERVKISDFGLARAVDDASLTQSGLVAGTPQFMSPEQAEGKRVDQRSDLFSLGSVLYALCTGRPPFRADSTPAVLRRVCESRPRPIRQLNPEIPEGVEALIRKLHAKAPEDRFQSAAEIAEELAGYLAALQLGGDLAAGKPEAPKAGGRAGREANGRGNRRPLSPSRPLRAPARLLAGLVVVLLAGGLAAWLLAARPWQRTGAPGSPADQRGAAEVPPQVVAAVHGPIRHRQGGNISSGVTSVAGSPDGKYVASAAATYDEAAQAFASWELNLWDPATGQLVRAFDGFGSAVRAVAFSPDGRRLAAACNDGAVEVLDVETGKHAMSLKGHTESTRSVAWSPDGKWIAGGSIDRTVVVWDAADGRKKLTFDRHTGRVLHVAFSPDGTRVASSAIDDDNTVRVWNVETGAEITQFRRSTGQLRGAAFSHDGKHVISVAEEPVARVWDAADGTELFELKGHTYDWVLAVAVSPDGKYVATAGRDGTVRTWEADTGRPLRVLPGHSGVATCVAWYGDGAHLASGDCNGQVHLWEAASGKELLR